jgi:hypothetical protein
MAEKFDDQNGKKIVFQLFCIESGPNTYLIN